MEEKKPNVFPGSENTPQQPLSEAEKQMIENREREMRERNIAKPAEQVIQPVTAGPQMKPSIIEPDFGSDCDFIPLPSGGKTYKNKTPNLKVSFMNASDENILTNPNLLKSGKFLEVLFTRKILDPSITYRDLLVGDRDAIMIWLRSTGYGSEYPITVIDPKTYEEFTVEIDLDSLKKKKLTLEPDEEGLFSYTFPMSNKNIKFKLLTVGDSEDIENHVEELKKDNVEFTDIATYTLQKQIVEVEGDRDPKSVAEFISRLRIADSRSFKKFVSENECGVDMNLTVQTPGGGQVKTFFRPNSRFFWPQL
jgi:hypothetical protein